jgi:hypothetical protein
MGRSPALIPSMQAKAFVHTECKNKFALGIRTILPFKGAAKRDREGQPPPGSTSEKHRPP